MSHRYQAAAFAVAAGVALMPAFAAAQPADATGSRTPWGHPDVQGIWDYRTLTPLERPEELGEKAFLTEEEAASLEQETVARNELLLNRAPQTTSASDQVPWALSTATCSAQVRRPASRPSCPLFPASSQPQRPTPRCDRREDGTPGFYNNFWLDRGTTAIATRRTSLVVDPADGRLPALTEPARRRAESAEAERIAAVRRGGLPAATYEDLDAGDRCIQHAKAGPPISTGGYNNNIQVFQTPDHVVILAEQNHDARIVPLDGRPHASSRIAQWMGDSRGYWDGDTLVVETVHFNGKHDQIATRRTSLVVDPADGRLPALTEPARRRAESAEAERIAAVRRGGCPRASAQWMGDSRGYWDGDTLVVETVHFNGKHDQIGRS